MILIAAIAVGAIAAFMIFNYVGSVEDQANEGAERVDVFVVSQDIPKGMTGEEAGTEGYIEQTKIAREFLPGTAIGSLDQIAGRVALNGLAANQVVVAGMFVDPAEAQVGFSQRLPDDQVAITISTDQVRGVAGLLVPGDKVDLMVSATCEDCSDDGVPTASQVRFVYHAVEILAIGQSAAPEPGENITAASTEGEPPAEGEAPAAEEPAITGDTGLITFNVPPDAAQLIAGIDPGEIYLALVGPDYQPTPIPVLEITPGMALPGETGSELTPYGPDGGE